MKEISFVKEKEKIHKEITNYIEKLRNELQQKVYDALKNLIGKTVTLYGSRLPVDSDYLTGIIVGLGLEHVVIQVDNIEYEIPYETIDKVLF